MSKARQSPRAHLRKQLSYRLIPSKYPPINLFEDVASADELASVWAIQALTNPRLRQEAGELALVPRQDWLVGIPHASFAMAPFTHLPPDGGRFSTREFGAYYCAPELETAIRETVYHRQRFMAHTREPAQELHMRCLVATFDAELVDVTGSQWQQDAIYHPDHYGAGQGLARELKAADEDGVQYLSVRHPGALCFALYRPRLISSICQGQHLRYVWDGEQITEVLEASPVMALVKDDGEPGPA